MKKVKTYPISEFKAKSLAILEQVARQGEEVQVTKRGKTLVRVLPMPQKSDSPALGRLKGTLLEEHDLISPLGARIWKAADSDSKDVATDPTMDSMVESTLESTPESTKDEE